MLTKFFASSLAVHGNAYVRIIKLVAADKELR